MTSSSNLDSKAWPTRSGPKYDEQGDFIQAEVQATVNSITDENNICMLSKAQSFQLMRMYRMAGAVSKNGVKWRSMGQMSELVAAVFSATVPVLVGLTTQFSKSNEPMQYWVFTILSITLSMLASVAVAVERVRGMKEQGVLERLEGADILLELKRFVGGCGPYAGGYRAAFPLLCQTVTTIQHKGTSELYAAFKSRSQDKTSEMNLGAAGGTAAGAAAGALGDLKGAADAQMRGVMDSASAQAHGLIGGTVSQAHGLVSGVMSQAHGLVGGAMARAQGAVGELDA